MEDVGLRMEETKLFYFANDMIAYIKTQYNAKVKYGIS